MSTKWGSNGGSSGGGGGSGTVTSVSVTSGNGLAGTVTNPTSTPAIALSTTITGIVKGNGTAFVAATAGTDYLAPTGTNAGALLQENVNVVAASGASQTIPDITSDTINEITLTASCNFTFPTGAAGKSFLLMLTQGGSGGYTAAWPASVLWSGGAAPTLTVTLGKTDIFTFVWNSTLSKWVGFIDGLNY